MDGFNSTNNGFNATGGGGGGGTPQESKAVKYVAQALTEEQQTQARTNINAATKAGEEPDLAAGDIIPKSTAPVIVSSKITAQTTGGDNDLKNGASQLLNIRGFLDENLNPFIADTFVSTGENLVDPNSRVTINSHRAYIFPVVAGFWGSYGTTQENNGYVVLSDVAPDAVYFKATKPTGSSHGDACPTHVYNGKTYYLPPTQGWLCIAMPDNTTVPSCHIAWSNSHDEKTGGTFGNTTKDISALVQWIHTWGMAGLIGPDRSVFDEIDFLNKKCYRRDDRARLADQSYTMTTETSSGGNQGETPVTTYIFKATLSTMKPDGLWRSEYSGVNIDGNEITIRSTSITSVADLLTDMANSMVYFELATYAEATFAEIGSSVDDESVANDYGLTYFMNSGDLVSVPAFVYEIFTQSGKDPLFNNVTYSKTLAEVVSAALNEHEHRIAEIEQGFKDGFEHLKVTNLEVTRKLTQPA